MKGRHDQIVDQRLFYAEASLFAGGTVRWLRLGGWAKFRGLEKRKKLSQSVANKHVVPIHQWGDEQYSSSFVKQRMGIWRVCVQLCHRLNMRHLSHI